MNSITRWWHNGVVVTALSDEQAELWRELADAATPGPWRTWYDDTDDDWPLSSAAGFLCVSPDDGVRGGHSRADAVFIAAAREAVPALLAERDALKAENERLHLQVESGVKMIRALTDELLSASGIVAAVEKLHQRCTHGPETAMWCETCEITWPCPTWRALHPSETPKEGE